MSIKNFLIRCAGHDPAALADHSADECRPLVLLGGLVLFVSLFAALNWAAAAYILTAGQEIAVRLAAAAAAGLLGFAIVFTVDRTAIYAMDTTAGFASKLRALPLFLVRLALIVMVGAVTAAAVMPLFFAPELKEAALRERERSDDKRRTTLSVRFELADRKRAVEAAEAALAAAKKAADELPAAIRAQYAEAERAQRAYHVRWVQLRQQGAPDHEVRAGSAWHYNRWQHAKAAADAAASAYREKAARALAAADLDYDAARKAAAKAKADFERGVAEGAAEEKQAIVPESSLVMVRLLRENRELKLKYVGIAGVILLLELLALLTKAVTPPSVPGARIAADTAVAVARHRSRFAVDVAAARTDRVVALAREFQRRRRARTETAAAIKRARLLDRQTAKAMAAAASSAAFQDLLAGYFEKRLAALAPFDVYRALMDELAERSADKTALIRKFPDAARFIVEAWAKALEDAIAAMQDAITLAPDARP